MSEKLCRKCRDRIIELFVTLTPLGEQWVSEVFHCHHGEPKEKEKCWCEIDNMDVWKYRKWCYCPKCGKKLED